MNEVWRFLSRLDDQRVSVCPVMAIAGEQPHALAFTLDNQAIAIMLYFVKPIRPGGDFGAACWDARLILILAHHVIR